MKVIFANITHGFVYADDGSTSESMKFTKFSIQDYINYFKKYSPNILCLAETLLDDTNGNSSMVEDFGNALDLPYYKSLGHEESWIYVGKYYGMAILSRYPICDYKEFKLPNPKFETIRPNGEHWIMHDKFAQYCKLETGTGFLNLFNIHYFALHHYHKKFNDPELEFIRKELADILTSTGSGEATIITGDLNNKDVKLTEAYPELFAEGKFKESIEVETTLTNGNDQLDHIIYSSDHLEVVEAKAEKYLSDHLALIMEFKMK